jgi:16S rRNA (guanine527-N7)-methyltransferase
MPEVASLERAIRALADRWDARGEGVEARLVAYARELERWNRRINLIRFGDWDELVSRHLVDGLAASARIPPDARSLIDVGSGGGIPGAVIAALRPELEVIALEPIHKKHAFLRAVRRSVPLPNFWAHALRLEEEGPPEDLRNRFDVAISRATWSVGEWIERGRGLVHPGGVVLAMEGRGRGDLPEGAVRHPYEADDRQRAIVAVRV